jgi:LAO/AO transport system kinase
MNSGADSDRELVTRAIAGDRRALARALTLLERGSPELALALASARASARPRAHRIGFTGPPGAGKSTLIADQAARLRVEGHRVGILAVDPTSAFTGGAILGDRVRMSVVAGDPEVFVRSFAARQQPGGLSETIGEAADLVALAGFDRVLIETVGIGQGDVGVAAVVDTVVVVLVPEAGDLVQGMKAGLVEIGDVIVINKADRPGAEAFAAEIRAALELRTPAEPIPAVLLTSAETGAGLAELAAAIEHLAAQPRAAGDRRRRAVRAHLLSLVAAHMERQFSTEDGSELEQAVDQVARDGREARQVARELWAKLIARP